MLMCLEIKTLKIHLKFPAKGWSAWGGKTNASGFTLLEMVIVMAMIGILSSASFKLIKFSDTHRSLSIATAEVKGAVRTAQTLALAPPVIMDGATRRVVCGFGVRNDSGVASDELEIYYSYSVGGDVKDCRSIATLADVCGGGSVGTDCVAHEKKYFDGFMLKQGGSGSDVDVFFRSPYGKVFGVAPGGSNITITQVSNNYHKNLNINEYGKINVQ